MRRTVNIKQMNDCLCILSAQKECIYYEMQKNQPWKNGMTARGRDSLWSLKLVEHLGYGYAKAWSHSGSLLHEISNSAKGDYN